ncbi:hypothetical protein BH11PSE2_BH11PSE2_11570 [soil metagenome]
MLMAAAGLALAGQTGAQAQASVEYPVKAAFLFKFGSFVDWPPVAFGQPTGPLIVCVVGRDPFGETLDRTVQGATVGARTVSVRRLSTVNERSGCNIAFLGGSAEQSIADSVKALASAPVLTVTDDARPMARGKINFLIRENHVRFEIDQKSASASGLTISSKLLNLAVSVRQ